VEDLVGIRAWNTRFLDLFLECILLTFFILFLFFIIMSQNLNFVPPFDGMNYGYWKARMRFFLKSIDVWKIVEIGWIKPKEIDEITVIQTSARLSNDKAIHVLCQVLSPSEFAGISNCEIAKDAWQILETTYKGTKLVKFDKLQMLISKFEEIKMLEE